jgi:S-adenosyl-L-methionine hydrolase (adenosine-forming)
MRSPISSSPSHPFSPSSQIITLLTDFGSADYFVASMKGVILSINAQARIVDITHEIPPQDIPAAAFTLLATYKAFPRQTIHVAVVDPGVGSRRRPILLSASDQFFVGPDNGIFSYILDRESHARVFEITNESYFRKPISPTFHGRDLFAPVAAALSSGLAPESFGREIQDCVRLAPLKPEKLAGGKIRARIIHIDRFGNCVTNLTPAELGSEVIGNGAALEIGRRRIKTIRRFFSEETGSGAEVFAIWGSAGFLEIAAMNQSAAKILKARPGQTVFLLGDNV